MIAWEPSTDHLGRWMPGRLVGELVADKDSWTSREVAVILSRVTTDEARAAIVAAAHTVGIFFGPADLAGKKCPIR